MTNHPHRHHSAAADTDSSAPKVGYKKTYTLPKLPKLDLTTDAEYVTNLVNVSMWL